MGDKESNQFEGLEVESGLPARPTSKNLVDTEVNQLEKDLKKHEAKTVEIRNRGMDQDIDERKIYANKISNIAIGWLIFSAFVLFGVATGSLILSDTVLIAFLTTNTATIIGLFVVVANYLFPKPPKD